jgi:hypothetical protein
LGPRFSREKGRVLPPNRSVMQLLLKERHDATA